MKTAYALAALLTASTVAATPVVHAASHIDVALTSGNGQPSLADASALVLGPTGNPTPADIVVNYYWQNYLADPASGGSEVAKFLGGNVSSGDTLALTTPEQFTQASYLDGDATVVHQLIQDYPGLLQHGATDPLYLLGYSQSSTILTAVDSHLNNQQWLDYVLTYGDGGKYASDIATLHGFNDGGTLMGIAPDLRLVLLGDPAADPGNGVPSGWDNNPATQALLNSENMGGGSLHYGGGTILDNGVLGHVNDATLCASDCTPGDLSDETTGYGMAGQNTNMDLSPTSVYTVYQDNWAQVQDGCTASFFFICTATGPLQGGVAHTMYPGLTASDFTFSDHVGSVDYFQDTPNFFQTMDALFAAGWLSLMAMF